MKYFVIFSIAMAPTFALCPDGKSGRNCQIEARESLCYRAEGNVNLGERALVNENFLPICNGTNYPCYYRPGTEMSYKCADSFGTCPSNTDFDDSKSCEKGCTPEFFVESCCEVRKPCFQGTYVFRGDPYCVCESFWAGNDCNSECVNTCADDFSSFHASACDNGCKEDGYFTSDCCKEHDKCEEVLCGHQAGKRAIKNMTGSKGVVQTRQEPTEWTERVGAFTFGGHMSKHDYTQEEANSECCTYVEVCEDHMKRDTGENKCALPLYGVCFGDCDDLSDFNEKGENPSACCEPETYRCDRRVQRGLNTCALGFKSNEKRCGENCDDSHFSASADVEFSREEWSVSPLQVCEGVRQDGAYHESSCFEKCKSEYTHYFMVESVCYCAENIQGGCRDAEGSDCSDWCPGGVSYGVWGANSPLFGAQVTYCDVVNGFTCPAGWLYYSEHNYVPINGEMVYREEKSACYKETEDRNGTPDFTDCGNSCCEPVEYPTYKISVSINTSASFCCDQDDNVSLTPCSPQDCPERTFPKQDYAESVFAVDHASECCNAIPASHFCDAFQCAPGFFLHYSEEYCNGECTSEQCCVPESHTCEFSGFSCGSDKFQVQTDQFCDGECNATHFATSYGIAGVAIPVTGSGSTCSGTAKPGVTDVDSCLSTCNGEGFSHFYMKSGTCHCANNVMTPCAGDPHCRDWCSGSNTYYDSNVGRIGITTGYSNINDHSWTMLVRCLPGDYTTCPEGWFVSSDIERNPGCFKGNSVSEVYSGNCLKSWDSETCCSGETFDTYEIVQTTVAEVSLCCDLPRASVCDTSFKCPSGYAVDDEFKCALDQDGACLQSEYQGSEKCCKPDNCASYSGYDASSDGSPKAGCLSNGYTSGYKAGYASAWTGELFEEKCCEYYDTCENAYTRLGLTYSTECYSGMHSYSYSNEKKASDLSTKEGYYEHCCAQTCDQLKYTEMYAGGRGHNLCGNPDDYNENSWKQYSDADYSAIYTTDQMNDPDFVVSKCCEPSCSHSRYTCPPGSEKNSEYFWRFQDREAANWDSSAVASEELCCMQTCNSANGTTYTCPDGYMSKARTFYRSAWLTGNTYQLQFSEWFKERSTFVDASDFNNKCCVPNTCEFHTGYETYGVYYDFEERYGLTCKEDFPGSTWQTEYDHNSKDFVLSDSSDLIYCCEGSDVCKALIKAGHRCSLYKNGGHAPPTNAVTAENFNIECCLR